MDPDTEACTPHGPFTWHLGICKVMVYMGCYWCSVTLSCLTLCDHVDCNMPGFPVLCCLLDLLKTMSNKSVMSSNRVILCCPLLLLPSLFPSITVFSNESALHIRWPNIGVSVSSWVLPMNIQSWFPLGWTGWISLQSKRLIAKEEHHALCVFTFQFKRCF